jgi:hypothetical protein
MAVLVLIAAISVASQMNMPVGDVLAATIPNVGMVAGVLFGSIFQTILLALLVLAVEVVVHEGGHLLGGKLVGFRFVTVVLGPLCIDTTQEGRKVVRLNRQVLSAGAALSVPTTTDHLRTRTAIMTVAGPLATLALCPLCWWLASVVQGETGRLIALIGLFSLALGITNLLPIQAGSVPSDGARLKMLALGGARAERLCYVAMVVGASRAGRRPRQWDPDWIRRITAPDDHTLDEAVACQVAYYWAVDTGNLDEAEGYLQRLDAEAATMPERLRPLFLVDSAFFYAYYRHDPATARRMLDESGEIRGKQRHMWLRAVAATLAAEGKPDEARLTAREGLEEIAHNPPTGAGWELDREWTEALAGA